MTAKVRPARSTDAARIAEFNIALARETEGVRLDPKAVLRAVERLLDTPERGRYFVVELDGRVGGQCLISTEPSDWYGGVYWWLQSVWVDPDARRQGVFRALWNGVCEAARAEGDVRALRLYVVDGNEAARAVYEATGMTASPYRIYEFSMEGR